jgi:PAS domain S-box-containing protein
MERQPEVALEVWSRYAGGDSVALQRLRPEVAASWQRCRSLALDPFQSSGLLLDSTMLQEHLLQRQSLVKLARPFMENLYGFVRGTGFAVILTNESGVLLDVLGDEHIVERGRRVQLCPGGDWSEAARGTNAIGTAIVEKKPVQIYAWEHYCRPNHFLTCSAAPIRDVDGAILGVLDISGDFRFANSHTLGMVVAAVSAIENQLRAQRLTDKLYRAYRYSNILLENMSDGLISIDNNGIVTALNAKAAELFGVNPAFATGSHVSSLRGAGSVLLPMLAGKLEREETRAFVNRMGREVRSSTSLLRDEEGNVIGAVAVLREVRREAALRPATHTASCYTFADIIGESPAMRAL